MTAPRRAVAGSRAPLALVASFIAMPGAPRYRLELVRPQQGTESLSG